MPSALFVLAMTAACSALCQPASLPERLSYPKGTKLLIIHADDFGVAHSENTTLLIHTAFTSDRCKQILRHQKIQLVTWREIRDKLFRN